MVAVGYDLVEYSPERWNPNRDKRIVHIHRTVAEVDAHYTLEVGLQGYIGETLDAIAGSADMHAIAGAVPPVRGLVHEELERGAADDSFPLKPQRIVADIRSALGHDDIVLCDTGAVKMWMARLYPTYRPNTCLISNGLATMAFSLAGRVRRQARASRAAGARRDGRRRVPDERGEIETAVREGVQFVVLVWVDGGYGLIGWKQDIQFGRQAAVSFGNPDFVQLAESFGAKGTGSVPPTSCCPRSGRRSTTRRSRSSRARSTTVRTRRLIERLGALTESI